MEATEKRKERFVCLAVLKNSSEDQSRDEKKRCCCCCGFVSDSEMKAEIVVVCSKGRGEKRFADVEVVEVDFSK